MPDAVATPRAAAAALFCLAILGAAVYFAHAAIQGDTGILARMRLEAQEARLRAELEMLRQERARMQNLTERLSERSLDLDLLDERARKTLGYIRPDEIVVR
ncbi:FtsB family cell division protein [Oceanicella actignis]|uniref:Septum formation initiator n=1 Tax=Oceanicella actignis TaxID=1189325 RepID=A0A1M7U063_9RHOB|nr:septum formation initiator family protein [Oceanicella actignis]TYO85032.1 septum formation initiator [Oceanicella actignis]SET83872.1 Septum formation initiator [Oceanicella actignis]SHN76313.1 Septum formation initiator [Oceanicella actignis]